jgi:hypothetical protein
VWSVLTLALTAELPYPSPDKIIGHGFDLIVR